jgi:hypothetical protein
VYSRWQLGDDRIGPWTRYGTSDRYCHKGLMREVILTIVKASLPSWLMMVHKFSYQVIKTAALLSRVLGPQHDLRGVSSNRICRFPNRYWLKKAVRSGIKGRSLQSNEQSWSDKDSCDEKECFVMRKRWSVDRKRIEKHLVYNVTTDKMLYEKGDRRLP